MRALPLLALGLTLSTAGVTSVAHAQPANLCRAGQSDTVERPAPDALLPRLGRTFAVAPETLRGGSFVRCAEGHLLGCMIGANLNCSRADVSRRSPGGDSFCRDTPDADTVPLAAVGHDTIYDWRCVGTRAVAGRIVAPVDRFGFMRQNWRSVQ